MSKHDKTQPLVEDIESFPRDLGEQRQVRTVDGRSPSEVVGMLEESMRTWNYEIQYDPVSFSPRRTR
jgi:hypothetical protein